MKMKFAFAFVLPLLLDVPHLNGQLKIEEYEPILLKFHFPSYYNSYDKSCCKLTPGECFKVLDSKGYTCDFMNGRVTKTESDGWIEFKILNAQLGDTGYYRCIVQGTEKHMYSDFLVEVSESSVHSTLSLPPLIITIEPQNTSTALPDPTGPNLAEDRSDSPRVPWSFGLALVAAVCISITVITSLVISIVCCRVKTKNQCEETLCDSSKQNASETSGIVYTTVDFRPHQEPAELYANVRMHSPGPRAPDSTWNREHAGTVEYSTLVINQ